ncbi:MAG: glutamate--tRNA ligase [Gemmatimonadota bacterium]
MIRTRFAPSPSGRLHVGNARIAVLNWLFARHHDGQLVLRIEDTDEARTVPGAEAAILEDLEWLGLDWNEGPGVEGPAGEGDSGPYRQSERGAIYREHAERLIADGLAFRCFCTARELEERRAAALARGEAPHYDGACRAVSDVEAARLEREGRSPAIRFRVSDEGRIVVRDVVRGEVVFEAAEIGDFIIVRSDGVPTYNFAVVVDDASMAITHVIRGAGHLSNSPRQVLLFEALGRELPVFAHVPTVLAPDRRKLSKRHGARPLADYRREGFHPDAMLNYLSLLSWSSPSGDEFLVRERLVNEISLDRIRASDAVFDPEKLRWLSARHIERMDLDALVDAVSPHIDRERHPIPDERLPAAVEAVRSHLSTFAGIDDHLDAFVPLSDDAASTIRRALSADPEAVAVIDAVSARLRVLEEWTPPALDDAVRAGGRAVGARGAALFRPLRLALTGEEHGPPLSTVLFVHGRSATLRVLESLRDAAGSV